MAKPSILTGLDIGTNTIKILTAAKKSKESELEVLAQFQEGSFGIRKGVVINFEEVSRIIQILLNRVREETGQKIDSVYVNIGGSHLFSTFSHGTVAISRADQKVSGEDIERVLQAAQTFSLPSNKEILDVFPKEFIVDGEGGIKEAEGMQGVRLEVEVLAVGGFSPYIKNLTQAVLNSDLQILDVIPSPLASATAVLSTRQKELGVAVLDIGAGTSGLAVFEEGDLIHLAIFPIGSANITNDIAIGLKTDIDLAEKIKIEFGSCVLQGPDKREKIKTEEEPLIFSKKMLTRIIEARVSEIFEEVQKELKKISKQGLLPAGVVLTGGGTKLPKIVELAKKELKLPCRIGRISGFPDLEEDSAFSNAWGLVLNGLSLEEEKGWLGGSKPLVRGGFGNKIKKMFRIFMP
jgi:cell division protein FtsA